MKTKMLVSIADAILRISFWLNLLPLIVFPLLFMAVLSWNILGGGWLPNGNPDEAGGFLRFQATVMNASFFFSIIAALHWPILKKLRELLARLSQGQFYTRSTKTLCLALSKLTIAVVLVDAIFDMVRSILSHVLPKWPVSPSADTASMTESISNWGSLLETFTVNFSGMTGALFALILLILSQIISERIKLQKTFDRMKIDNELTI